MASLENVTFSDYMSAPMKLPSDVVDGQDCIENIGKEAEQSSRKKRKKKKKSIRDYNCDTCGKHYLNKYHYEVHLRSHTGERPFVCSICGASFKKSSNLMEHRKRHLGIKIPCRRKPTDCTVCGKVCYGSLAFRNHMATHNEELQYTCDKCGKKYIHRSSYRRHLIVESGIRKYACDICGMRSVDKGDLRKHLLVHGNTKQYICTACGKGFIHSGSYRKHKCKATSSLDKPEKPQESETTNFSHKTSTVEEMDSDTDAYCCENEDIEDVESPHDKTNVQNESEVKLKMETHSDFGGDELSVNLCKNKISPVVVDPDIKPDKYYDTKLQETDQSDELPDIDNNNNDDDNDDNKLPNKCNSMNVDNIGPINTFDNTSKSCDRPAADTCQTDKIYLNAIQNCCKVESSWLQNSTESYSKLKEISSKEISCRSLSESDSSMKNGQNFPEEGSISSNNQHLDMVDSGDASSNAIIELKKDTSQLCDDSICVRDMNTSSDVIVKKESETECQNVDVSGEIVKIKEEMVNVNSSKFDSNDPCVFICTDDGLDQAISKPCIRFESSEEDGRILISTSSNENRIENEGRKVVSKELHVCRHCKQSYDNKKAYLKHLRIVHFGKTKWCKKCGIRVKWRDWDNHSCAVCAHCSKVYTTVKSLKKHNENQNPCLNCNKIFCSFAKLHDHYRYTECSVSYFKCNLCDKFYYTEEAYDKHQMKHKKETSKSIFVCQRCHKQCFDRVALMRHMKQSCTININTLKTAMISKLDDPQVGLDLMSSNSVYIDKDIEEEEDVSHVTINNSNLEEHFSIKSDNDNNAELIVIDDNENDYDDQLTNIDTNDDDDDELPDIDDNENVDEFVRNKISHNNNLEADGYNVLNYPIKASKNIHSDVFTNESCEKFNSNSKHCIDAKTSISDAGENMLHKLNKDYLTNRCRVIGKTIRNIARKKSATRKNIIDICVDSVKSESDDITDTDSDGYEECSEEEVKAIIASVRP